MTPIRNATERRTMAKIRSKELATKIITSTFSTNDIGVAESVDTYKTNLSTSPWRAGSNEIWTENNTPQKSSPDLNSYYPSY